jgi:hypothetical protein
MELGLVGDGNWHARFDLPEECTKKECVIHDILRTRYRYESFLRVHI